MHIKNVHGEHKFFGSMTVGPKGQVVIPASARKELGLDTGVTLLGSTHFLHQSGKQPSELRRMVTSPGGTTAEALARLEKGQFAELVKQAVEAAYNKAKRLVK